MRVSNDNPQLTLTISNRFHSSNQKFRMKLSLPLLVFAVFATTDVVAGKKKVTQSSKKLRGNKNNVLRNKDNKLDAVPSRVESDRDLQQDVTTKIVGGNNANNGEYPFFGESVQSTSRRLKCAGYTFIRQNRERKSRDA